MAQLDRYPIGRIGEGALTSPCVADLLNGGASIDPWRYWAKSGDGGTYHPLPAHLLDVAAVGDAYLEAHPTLCRGWADALQLAPADFRRLMCWWLAVHDIGKFCDRFQGANADLAEKLWSGRPRRQNKFHHTTLGSILIQDEIIPPLAAELGANHPWGATGWRHVLGALEPPFAGHHGQPPEADVFPPDAWDEEGREAARAWTREVSGLFPLATSWNGTSAAREVSALIRAASWHLAGFAVLCDWVGSNSQWFPVGASKVASEVHWSAARSRAARALREAGVLPTTIASPMPMRAMFDKEATPLQRELEAWNPGPGPNLLILEDTTGSGKTEAALLAAHRILAGEPGGGFYFALPTQATANAMYARLQVAAPQMFEDPSQASLVLAHGGRIAMREFRDVVLGASAPGACDEGRSQCSAWLADSRKKAFLAHAGAGTIDQALLGVLPVKHQSLRLFGLTSRVLIVDEVHAYDAYATRLLETLLEFHASAGGSAILISATMPRALRARLARAFSRGAGRDAPALTTESYPLATFVSDRFEERAIAAAQASRRTLRVNLLTERDAVHAIVTQAARAGRCVCWIRNTVDEAIGSWEALRALEPMLFHARFTEEDRARVERDVLRWAGPDSTPAQRSGKVLVATQVVEQSLDLDFDVVISDLAPIELLLQRAGRLHRHPWRRRDGQDGPVLYVWGPPTDDAPGADWIRKWSEGTAAVYKDHGRLWLSQQALQERGQVVVPEDLRGLVESVYGEDSPKRIPEGLHAATERAQTEGRADRSHAQVNVLNLANGYRSRDAAWSDPDRARTRSGEPGLDLYLAARRDGNVEPLHGEDAGWEAARVRVRLPLAKRAGVLERLESSRALPSWVEHVVILVEDSPGRWRSEPSSTPGALLVYDSAGLRIDSGDTP